MKPLVIPLGFRDEILKCEQNFTCIEQLVTTTSEACKDIDNCRTLSGIIWSCIATLVACTWVSVHPNVPDIYHGQLSLALHRFKLMLLAIIAPEVIILWALRQRLVARKLSRDHGLHIIHGFFVSMGGFVRAHATDTGTVYPIASHDIGRIVSVRTIHDIDIEEIEDHSKGDEISKGLALLQTGWFIVQCIARARQHLPLTELEIVTLAFATLNIIIRVIWWEKPLDVRYPITIPTTEMLHIKDTPKPAVTAGPHAVQDLVATPEFDATSRPVLPTTQTPTSTAKAPKRKPEPRRHLLGRCLHAIARACDQSVDITLMMFEGDENDAYISRSATRVPTLWAGRLDGRQRGVAATIGIVLAMGFGAIHFAAWDTSFPSEPERLLWRVASILVVVVPFIFFLGAAVVLKKGQLPRTYHDMVFNGIIPLGVFVYVIARAVLMVLPFITLRSLPPEALKDVEWVDFIPHIG